MPTKERVNNTKIIERQIIKKDKIILITTIVTGIPNGAANIQRMAIKKVLSSLFSPKLKSLFFPSFLPSFSFNNFERISLAAVLGEPNSLIKSCSPSIPTSSKYSSK